MGAVDDDLVGHPLGIRQALHLRHIVARDAGRRRKGECRGRAAGDDARLGSRMGGDDLARSRLQFGDVDEGARGLPHGVERLRIHEAAAEARQEPRSVHPLRDGQTLVDIHEP